MMIQNVYYKPAQRIKAFKIKETKGAYLLNCEGDIIWFPRYAVRLNFDGTADIQTVILQEKFPNENFHP